MKKICYFLLSLFLLTSCDDKYRDDRVFEAAKIVAVKANDVLYSIDNTGNNEAKIILPAGVNLTALKAEILVANGKLVGFENNIPQDLTKPVDIQIEGEYGDISIWKLIVQSPPLLVSLDAVGLSIPKEKVNIGKTTIIVEIPEGTDTTNLAVSFGFLNGTIQNFTNGTPKDYSTPFRLNVLGVDGVTVYGYDVVFTSDPVGPALLKGMVINGDATSEILVIDAATSTIQPVVPYLTNFSNANIALDVAFGNVVDPNFNTTNIDLLKGFKVKITGTNGVETEFTVKNPLIQSTPILDKTHAAFEFAANAGSSAAFSGNNIVIAANAMLGGATATLGINAYDLSGNYLNGLSKTGTNFDGGGVTGIRKLATDDDGRILGVQLGAGAGADVTLSIFRWNSITDENPTAYISYTQTSLGTTSARAAGINISGSLAGNATIAVPIAQKTDVLVWTVTNGVLNPVPQKREFPYAGTGFYYSVQPYSDGFIGASTGINFSGINVMSSTLNESAKITGTSTTDAKTITYKGRKYVAYTAQIGGRHVFRIVDFTTPNVYALSNPIMSISRAPTSNANVTVDSDFKVINNKLHVLFYGTNDGLAVYKLEQ
ncbi:hypothetical protein [Mariniflexile sp.]|uniref:hypothetical protein n=2 Tax=Mariniflexile sp. TaxID=1979402 RepID=UPI004047C1A1